MAMTQKMMTIHRVLGLVCGVMILIAAGTAIGMNHADLIENVVTHGAATEGPYANTVLATAVDPQDAKHVLLGTTGGLFASHDAGSHWLPLKAGDAGARVGSLAWKSDTHTLYAAVGADTVLASQDGGAHFASVTLPFAADSDTNVRALSLNAQSELVVATNAGLYARSGTRWSLAARPVVPGRERARAIAGLIERLHMGDVWGRFGIPVTDLVALSLIMLVLSGYFLYIGRELKIRAARRKVRITMAARAAVKPAAPAKPVATPV